MLQEQRQEIVETLEEVIKTYPFLPEKPVVPCAVITPGTTFLTLQEDQGFNRFETTNWVVTLFVGVGTNQAMTQGLDALIEGAVNALWENTGFDSIVVNGLQEVVTNGATYLAVAITLTKETQGGINNG
jgi:hypothetical protein